MLYRITLCLALCCSFAVAGDLVPAALPAGLGIDIHFTAPRPGEMKMLRAAGFRIVRMDITWSRTEKQKGRYDFAAYDRLLKTMENNGMRPLWILCYSNPLYDDNLSPHTDEGRRAFAAWATAAAKHFAGHHIIWEMYNEPEGFWKPKFNPDAYIKLALEVGKAIHQAEPNEILVGPAGAHMDMPLVEKCCKAGLLNYWSAVTVHPYRKKMTPESVTVNYRTLRQIINRYAPKGKHIPIFSGEWGYSDVWPGFDQAKQAKYLARMWLIDAMDNVPVSIWYDWHDDGTDPKNPLDHLGTVGFQYHPGRDPVYDPKPAYHAAKTITTLLDGCVFEKRLATADANDYVLRFRKGGQTALAAWTTLDHPHDLTIPALRQAKYATWNYLGEKGPKLEASDAGLRLRLDDAPMYLISTPLSPSPGTPGEGRG